MSKPFTIALVGNPNSGKSSLFNLLTGLNQKVGNYPGVTVDKKTGQARLPGGLVVHVTDLPGMYSLYPRSADEHVAWEVLLNPAGADRPDLVVVIADASNLKRNLLFCTQIMDLGYPVVIGLTMADIARQRGITVDTEALGRLMGVPVAALDPRSNKGIARLRELIKESLQHKLAASAPFIDTGAIAGTWIAGLQAAAGLPSGYVALQYACNYLDAPFIPAAQRIMIAALAGEAGFHKSKAQAEEIMARYRRIDEMLAGSVAVETQEMRVAASDSVDKVLLHRIWGNIILLAVLMVLFQSLFWLAAYPMDWIEQFFAYAGRSIYQALPPGAGRELLVNGILAGIGGVVVFVPQIMILFGFITLLEDSGYMARISFLTDRLMRSAGLNGKSVMPLISGMACAVPAIMSARTIQNRKERLITILVTPLVSCSARLPVYTILIAVVVPDKTIGIFNLKGLVMMALYLAGFFMALAVANALSLIVQLKEKTLFLMELPVYRAPRWRNVVTAMAEKAAIFVTDVGRVIMVLSIVLWLLAYYGPPARMRQVNERYKVLIAANPHSETKLKNEWQTARLENSFAGMAGQVIAPVVAPLGFDWKIGIALITSFAAREVFVATMATLYSVGEPGENMRPLEEKMKAAKNGDGAPVFSLAVGLSLLVFYAFAMQCISTLAVVKRETRSWKYPAIQFAYMLALAWCSSFLVYQLFSHVRL